ncbi:MAG: hypothetical protein ACXACE_00225 [Candidatus Thorarchaeota archaeon]
MKSIHNRTPLILSLLGGALMIASGASGTLGYMGDMLEGMNAFFDAEFLFTFEIIIGILATLTSLGGFIIIISGIILTTKYVEIGRIIILIAIGMGILSLIMTLVQLVLAGTLALGLTIQLAQSLGWIGAMMAVVARTIAEQQPIISH